MNRTTDKELEPLSGSEIGDVHGGGGPLSFKLPQAQDVWGNTMSMEEWMDRQIAVANSNGELDPFDFYDDGYNPDKPNIWR